jgi:hypothetical protein
MVPASAVTSTPLMMVLMDCTSNLQAVDEFDATTVPRSYECA